MRLTSDQLSGAHNIGVNRRLPPGWASAVVLAALLLIFRLDRVTGSAPVQHLYYLPIIFAGIRFGHRGGLTVAGAAIVLYHMANPHVLTFRYEELDLVEMVLFVAVGVTSARLADDARNLNRLANTDDLTGLHNLRSFEKHLRAMIRTSRNGGTPLSVLVLDVDRLKSLNDVYGHRAGGEAVRTVGHLIAAHLPRNAVACRYGGDEFVIGIPDCSESRALSIADDLRRVVNSCAPVLADVPFSAGTLSISVGVASRRFGQAALDESSDSDIAAGDALFQAADAALYAAKRNGRNGVSAEPSLDSSAATH